MGQCYLSILFWV